MIKIHTTFVVFNPETWNVKKGEGVGHLTTIDETFKKKFDLYITAGELIDSLVERYPEYENNIIGVKQWDVELV